MKQNQPYLSQQQAMGQIFRRWIVYSYDTFLIWAFRREQSRCGNLWWGVIIWYQTKHSSEIAIKRK